MKPKYSVPHPQQAATFPYRQSNIKRVSLLLSTDILSEVQTITDKYITSPYK
jgi:hypothetical protein